MLRRDPSGEVDAVGKNDDGFDAVAPRSDEIGKAIISSLNEFRQSDRPLDDVTLVVIRKLAPASALDKFQRFSLAQMIEEHGLLKK